MQCLLCLSPKLGTKNHQSIPHSFFECLECGLIFKDPQLFLNWKEQEKRYAYHHNNPNDQGYLEFLMRLIGPLRSFIKVEDRILDWGSGPQPALKFILQGMGFQVDIYDPIYQPQIPRQQYAVITSTEVIEHFQNPRDSFQILNSLLEADGVLGIMTEVYRSEIDFRSWWYAMDPTHVVFYQEKTIQWLAHFLKAKILFFEKSVIILKRTAPNI